MKINKLAIFAFVSCLNVLATVVEIKELPIELASGLGINQSPSGYIVNLDIAVENLKPEVKNYFETNGFITKGNVLLAKIDKDVLESVGISHDGSDFTFDTETAETALKPEPYNALQNAADVIEDQA
jgi:hypothetical protein